MPYKRPDMKRPEKEHPIQKEFGLYGFINVANDPGWIAPHLQELHDDSRFALSQFSGVIDSAKAMDMSDYKPEIAAAKRAEQILKAKRALFTFLSKHITKYQSEANAVSNAILRITQPDAPSDPIKAMLLEFRHKEIRDNLKQINPKDRRAAVEGNLERIQAIISNPDPSNIIIDANALTEMRREYAFKQDPSLVEQEKDQRQIYRAVRGRAADISATCNKMILYSKLDDPMTEAEFYQTFQPESAYEQEIARNRIKAEERRQAELQKEKDFNEKHDGIDLGRDERVARIARGIPH